MMAFAAAQPCGQRFTIADQNNKNERNA